MKNREEYTNSVHTLGRITNSIAIILMIMVPIATTIVTKTNLNLEKFASLGLPLVIVYTVVCITEVLAYTPILGPTGAYLSFITGNIGNMKIPAAMSAQASIDAKKGTEEAEIASTLAIATSSLVTVGILTLGVIGIDFLKPYLENEILKPGFNNVTPALLGAFATPFVLKSPKKAIIPVITILIISYIFPLILPVSISSKIPMFLMPVVVIVSFTLTFLNFQKNNKKVE